MFNDCVAEDPSSLPPCSFCGERVDLDNDVLFTPDNSTDHAICATCVRQMAGKLIGVPEGVGDMVLMAVPVAVAEHLRQLTLAQEKSSGTVH